MDSQALIKILSQTGEATSVYYGEELRVSFMNQAMINLLEIAAAPLDNPLRDLLSPTVVEAIFPHIEEIWTTATIPLGQRKVTSRINGGYAEFTYTIIFDESGQKCALVHTATPVAALAEKGISKTNFEQEALVTGEILASDNSGASLSSGEQITSNLEQLSTQNDELRRSSHDMITLNDRLTESTQHFRLLVEQAPVAILVFKGPQLIIEMANPPILEILHRQADIIGKPILESMPELRGEPAVELIFEVYRTGKASYGQEVPVKMLREGLTETRYFNFSYRPMIDNGEIIGVMDIAVEVTDQVHSRQELEKIILEKTDLESSLRDSEQYLQKILDTMAEGVGIVDEKGELVYANHMAEKILGLSKDEIKGRKYSEPSWQNLRLDGTPLPDSEHPMSKMMKSGEPFYDQEIAVQQTNGERIYISINAAPIFGQDGKLSGGIGTFMDVTNRRKLAMQKDDFIGVASHELKTPVTSLKAALQLLMRMHNSGKHELSGKLIEQANKSMEKLTELTQALLDVSRMDHDGLQINLKKFDLVAMAKDYASQLSGHHHHQVIFKGADLMMVMGDEQQLEQVFVNFLSNAIKYAPGSQSIEVTIIKENHLAILSVRDFGKGIDSDQRGKIFDRYYRANNNSPNVTGLGLGLYISAEIVKKHGGNIGLTSEVGEGSTFWFSLPISVA